MPDGAALSQTEIVVTIPGRPLAKQRPRFARGGIAFTPKQTVNAEAYIRLAAAERFPAPLEGPVAVEIIAAFAPAASWSRVKRQRAIGMPHIQRPDLDNIVKLVTDALNGIAYRDDGQIAEVACRKVWSEVEQTVVIVRQNGWWTA